MPLVKIIPETIASYDNDIILLNLMLIVKSSVRKITASSTLIRKVKWILLLLRFEDLFELSFWVLPVYFIPRVSQIGGGQSVGSSIVHFKKHASGWSCVFINLNALYKQSFQGYRWVNWKQFLHILAKLFGKKARVYSLLSPSTDTVCNDKQIFLCYPSIFSSSVAFLLMGNVGCSILELKLRPILRLGKSPWVV